MKAQFQSATYHFYSCSMKIVQPKGNLLFPLLNLETQIHQWPRFGFKEKKGLERSNGVS